MHVDEGSLVGTGHRSAALDDPLCMTCTEGLSPLAHV